MDTEVSPNSPASAENPTWSVSPKAAPIMKKKDDYTLNRCVLGHYEMRKAALDALAECSCTVKKHATENKR